MSLSRTVLLPTGLAMTFGFGLADVPLRRPPAEAEETAEARAELDAGLYVDADDIDAS